ncbi:MAG: apolipoprotein N-acyltransferase, partial [Planctomycetota bacterium]
SWFSALVFSFFMFLVFAFPFALFGGALGLGKKNSRFWLASSGWLAIEFFLAEFLPWTPACCFMLSPAQSQWAGIVGRYGLMIWLIGFNLWIVNGHKSWIFAYVIFLLGGEAMKESWTQKLHREKQRQPSTSIGMVQAGITRSERKTSEGIRQGRERLHQLTNSLPLNNATLVLWPEGSIDESDPSAQCLYKGAILFGVYARRFSEDRSDEWVENQMLLKGAGSTSQYYLKRRLTPIGEKSLSRLPGLRNLAPSPPYYAGEKPNLISWNDLNVGGLICYEDLFVDLAVESTYAGATVLIALTNDVWFDAPAVALHTRLARLRAIENRRFFLRCNNTGPSEIIAPDGSVQTLLSYGAVGVASGELFARTEYSWFTMYFSALPWLGLLFPMVLFFQKKPH